MIDLSALPSLRESLEAHGLLANKGLGQHFLLDLNITRKIARLAGPLEGRTVLEVGPGPGGLPRALLEAGACGRPIVTTDVPGCNDVVEDGVTGFTVPPQDWVGLADAIEKLALSATLRVKMGVKMRDKVVAQFSEAFVVRQTINLYLAALDADKFRREGSNP